MTHHGFYLTHFQWGSDCGTVAQMDPEYRMTVPSDARGFDGPEGYDLHTVTAYPMGTSSALVGGQAQMAIMLICVWRKKRLEEKSRKDV